MKNKRQTILNLAKYGVSLTLVSYLLYTAWSSDQFGALFEGGVIYWRYAVATLFAFTAIVITFVRWFSLVRGLNVPFRLWDALRFGFVGYFFNFLTVGTVGGDALRAFFVAKQTPGHRTEAVATVIFDRLIGLIALFMLTGIAFCFIDLPALCADDPVTLAALEFCRWFSLVAGLSGTVGLMALCLFGSVQLWSLWTKLFELPLAGRVLKRLFDAAVVYSSRPGIVLGAYFGSFPVHFLNAASVYMIATSLPIVHPGLLMHCAAVPLSNLAGVLPLPGGIGAFEGMLAVLYEAMAESPEAADHGLLVAFGFRIVTLLVATVGIFIYLAERREIDQLQAESRAEAEHDSKTASA